MFGQFTLNGGFQTILCFVLILLIGGFAYIEISRLKKRVDSLSNEIKMLSHPVKQSESTKDLGVSFDTKIHPENNSVVMDQTFDTIQQTDLFTLMKGPVASSTIDMSTVQPVLPISKVEPEDKYDELSESEKNRTELDDEDVKGMLDFVSEKKDEVSQPQEQIIDKEQCQPVSQPEVESSDTPDDTIKIITSKPSSVYDSKTVSELKEILQEKGLPLSGNKTKLIKRILEHEQTQK